MQVIKNPIPRFALKTKDQITIKRGQKTSVKLNTDIPASKAQATQRIDLAIENNAVIKLVQATRLAAGAISANIELYASHVGSTSIEAELNGSIVSLPVEVVEGGLILSQVLYDPSGADNGNEWVEIYNDSAESIDLGNFSLTYFNKENAKNFVPLQGRIEPGQCILIGDAEDNSLRFFKS